VKLPSFSYIKIAEGEVARTVEMGAMTLGWTRRDGSVDPEPHELTDIIIDLDEDGAVLGVEFLWPTTVLPGPDLP
jgi:uncharacterized protein YuzE